MAGPIAKLRRHVIEELLAELDFIMVVVNPAHPGVELPAPLREGGAPVPLEIGRRMPLPIPDLRLDDEGIEATLSFARTPHLCRLPWSAIVQVSVGEEHLVWLCPDGLARPSSSAPREEASRPRLKLV